MDGMVVRAQGKLARDSELSSNGEKPMLRFTIAVNDTERVENDPIEWLSGADVYVKGQLTHDEHCGLNLAAWSVCTYSAKWSSPADVRRDAPDKVGQHGVEVCPTLPPSFPCGVRRPRGRDDRLPPGV